MRPNTPPSNAKANNIHHQDQLTALVNFKITNISVNMCNSFFLTHYDYIQTRQKYQYKNVLLHRRKTVIAPIWATNHPSISCISVNFTRATPVLVWARPIRTSDKETIPINYCVMHSITNHATQN